MKRFTINLAAKEKNKRHEESGLVATDTLTRWVVCLLFVSTFNSLFFSLTISFDSYKVNKNAFHDWQNVISDFDEPKPTKVEWYYFMWWHIYYGTFCSIVILMKLLVGIGFALRQNLLSQWCELIISTRIYETL